MKLCDGIFYIFIFYYYYFFIIFLFYRAIVEDIIFKIKKDFLTGTNLFNLS